MSQFYENAKSMISSGSFGPKRMGTSFLGACPSIGVAVLKRSSTGKKLAESTKSKPVA